MYTVCKILLLLPLVTMVMVPVYYLYLRPSPPLPAVDLNAWWGEGQPKEDTSIRPFTVQFKDEVGSYKSRYSWKVFLEIFENKLNVIAINHTIINSGDVGHWRPMWRSGGSTRLLCEREVSGSIPAQCKHVCLYWVWVFLWTICMYIQKNDYKYVFIRHLES
jgi:hypothetical protein